MSWLINIIQLTLSFHNIEILPIQVTLISWCSPFLNQGLYEGIDNLIQILIEHFIRDRVDPDQTPKNKV